MQSTNYFHLLVYSALIDGVLQDEELTLLSDFAKRLKLPASKANEIFKLVETGEGLPFQLPTKPKKAKSLFRHLARVVAADHKLVPEELKLILKLGRRLGLSDELIHRTVDSEMAKTAPEPLPIDDSFLTPNEAELELMPTDEELQGQINNRPNGSSGRPVITDEPVFASSLKQGDYVVLNSLARNMLISGVFLWVIPGLLVAWQAFFLFNLGDRGFQSTRSALVTGLLIGATAIFVGLKTLQAAFAFRTAQGAERRPIRLVVEGLAKLNSVYLTQNACFFLWLGLMGLLYLIIGFLR